MPVPNPYFVLLNREQSFGVLLGAAADIRFAVHRLMMERALISTDFCYPFRDAEYRRMPAIYYVMEGEKR